jgi:hypothetical protein
MSRRGNAYDNAKAEIYIKTLKYEEVYLFEYETVAAGPLTHRSIPRRGL